MLSLYVYQWKWQAAVLDPAPEHVSSDTGVVNTITTLKFHTATWASDTPTVDELMMAIPIGTQIRLKDTGTTSVHDWLTSGLAVKSGQVWSLPVTAPGSGSGVFPDGNILECGFLLDQAIPGNPPEPPPQIPGSTTVGDAVNEVRSMIQGSFADEVSILLDDYVAGTDTIVLKYPKRSLVAGGVLSVGLNTFYVLSITPDGTNITILPKYDGGPDNDMPAGSIVRIKPQFTNWAIFRELATDIGALTSPFSALWAPVTFESSVNQFSGMYPIPVEVGAVQKLVRVRVRRYGTGEWTAVTGGEYLPEQNAIRLYGYPDGSVVEFTVATQYVVPTSLDDDLLTFCHIPPEAQDIPTYGAAAALALANEGRRQQPFSQGDPRKAIEVQAGANIGVSRSFAKTRQDRVRDEQARLIQVFGYQRHITTQTADGSGGFGRSGARW